MIHKQTAPHYFCLVRVAQPIVFCIVFCRLLLVFYLFILVIVLSILHRFTAFNYLFGSSFVSLNSVNPCIFRIKTITCTNIKREFCSNESTRIVAKTNKLTPTKQNYRRRSNTNTKLRKHKQQSIKYCKSSKAEPYYVDLR